MYSSSTAPIVIKEIRTVGACSIHNRRDKRQIEWDIPNKISFHKKISNLLVDIRKQKLITQAKLAPGWTISYKFDSRKTDEGRRKIKVIPEQYDDFDVTPLVSDSHLDKSDVLQINAVNLDKLFNAFKPCRIKLLVVDADMDEVDDSVTVPLEIVGIDQP